MERIFLTPLKLFSLSLIILGCGCVHAGAQLPKQAASGGTSVSAGVSSLNTQTGAVTVPPSVTSDSGQTQTGILWWRSDTNSLSEYTGTGIIRYGNVVTTTTAPTSALCTNAQTFIIYNNTGTYSLYGCPSIAGTPFTIGSAGTAGVASFNTATGAVSFPSSVTSDSGLTQPGIIWWRSDLSAFSQYTGSKVIRYGDIVNTAVTPTTTNCTSANTLIIYNVTGTTYNLYGCPSAGGTPFAFPTGGGVSTVPNFFTVSGSTISYQATGALPQGQVLGVDSAGNTNPLSLGPSNSLAETGAAGAAVIDTVPAVVPYITTMVAPPYLKLGSNYFLPQDGMFQATLPSASLSGYTALAGSGTVTTQNGTNGDVTILNGSGTPAYYGINNSTNTIEAVLKVAVNTVNNLTINNVIFNAGIFVLDSSGNTSLCAVDLTTWGGAVTSSQQIGIQIECGTGTYSGSALPSYTILASSNLVGGLIHIKGFFNGATWHWQVCNSGGSSCIDVANVTTLVSPLSKSGFYVGSNAAAQILSIK